jgi:hypothetical protein
MIGLLSGPGTMREASDVAQTRILGRERLAGHIWSALNRSGGQNMLEVSSWMVGGTAEGVEQGRECGNRRCGTCETWRKVT